MFKMNPLNVKTYILEVQPLQVTQHHFSEWSSMLETKHRSAAYGYHVILIDYIKGPVLLKYFGIKPRTKKCHQTNATTHTQFPLKQNAWLCTKPLHFAVYAAVKLISDRA